MSAEITVALVSLLGTLVGTFTGIITSTKLTNYRIEQLEERVKVHNNLVEKYYRLEDNDKLLEEKISVANHRIADLEGEIKK